MALTNQYYSEDLLRFVINNYGDVSFLVEYMNNTSLTGYTDFYSGRTQEQPLPELTTPITKKYIPEEVSDVPLKRLDYKSINQNLFNVVLQNYGDITKIIQHLNDTNTTDYKLYRDNFEYKQDNISNNYTNYLLKQDKMIATNDDIMKIIPSGTTIDNYGDYSNDFSSDFKLI